MPLSINPRILFIDNYSESSQLIDMWLYIKKCKYDFSIANTPSKALEMIASQKFNLYILEYKLPEMNGIELCRQIRRTDKETPILFFTSRTRPFDRETALAAGATEYIVKPAGFEQITNTIKQLLGETKPSFVPNARLINNHNIRHLS